MISPTIVGRGVGRELDAALEIEAVDRLEQPDRADLNQIVERLAAVGELDREEARQVEMRHDEFVAQPLVFGLSVLVGPRILLGVRAQG